MSRYGGSGKKVAHMRYAVCQLIIASILCCVYPKLLYSSLSNSTESCVQHKRNTYAVTALFFLWNSFKSFEQFPSRKYQVWLLRYAEIL